jgi:hypothetical protein
MWDGSDIFWRFSHAEEWDLLSPSAQFPGLTAQFNACAPSELANCAPPFVTALPEPGTLQLWTGLLARTAPGWHLLLRAPANVPPLGGYSLYEGIVATDSWFGPLFTNLRLTRTNVPISLRSDYPLMSVQPVHKETYSDQILSSARVMHDLADFQENDWADYRATIVVPNQDPNRPFGGYATAVRKGRAKMCPMHARQPEGPA